LMTDLRVRGQPLEGSGRGGKVLEACNTVVDERNTVEAGDNLELFEMRQYSPDPRDALSEERSGKATYREPKR
jgi:hypothetical protein